MARLSHLKALQALEASIRHGSFRAAAVELGVTAAAVGQQVRNLEEALGQTLLIRHPNGFEPTDAALLAMGRLSAGFENLGEAVNLLARRNTPHRVSVSIAPTIAEGWLAPRLSDFLIGHPEIDLRIDSTHHLFYEAKDAFDFAIRYAPPSSAGHKEIELFREHLIPVCTPEVAASVEVHAGADALVGAPLLHVDRETSDSDWLGWDEWGAKFGFVIPRPSQRLRFTRTTLALRSVFNGYGLLLSQLSIVLPDLDSGRLVAPFGSSKAVRTGYPYRLTLTGRGRQTSLQRAFMEWVCREAKKTQRAMDDFLAR